MRQTPEILAALRQAVENYHGSLRWNAGTQHHRDPFIHWYRQSVVADSGNDLRLRILIILVNARFDQGTLAERALENTQRVLQTGVLTRDQISLNEVPTLNNRQRVKVDRWRELFWRSLPGLRDLSSRIAGNTNWKASDVLGAITRAKVPYFGPKTARLAVRWLSELVPEICVDMTDSEVPVDSLVYRVAARLGLIDPERDKYSGPGSPGHERIQEVARALFPHDPSLMDEPVWMMGRQSRNGGFCYPITPACDRGCLFAAFCPRSSLDRDPSAIGYSNGSPKPTPQRSAMHCSGPRVRAAAEATVKPQPVSGLLVIVSCVKNKIWDVDPSTPTRSPARVRRTLVRTSARTAHTRRPSGRGGAFYRRGSD